MDKRTIEFLKNFYFLLEKEDYGVIEPHWFDPSFLDSDDAVDVESTWAKSLQESVDKAFVKTELDRANKLDRLKKLLRRCPLGWNQNKLIRIASANDQDVLKWLQELYELIPDRWTNE